VRRTLLNDSLRLLLQACVAAALLVTPACADESSNDPVGGEEGETCDAGWDPAVDVELQASGTIVSLTQRGGQLIALTREGTLIPVSGTGTAMIETLPAQDLRAWVELDGGARLAVGDDGLILRSASSFAEWTVVDAGISEDLIDVIAASDGAWALAIASNRVLYSSDAGVTWTELPAPAGSWTGLRRLFPASGSYWLIGDGGQAWTTADPNAGWEAFELDTSADLIDAHESGCDTCLVIASADTLHIPSSGASLPAPEGEVFIALGDGYAVTDRAVYSILPDEPLLAKVQNLDFTPTAVAGDTETIYVAGTGGELVQISRWYCL
jgi:hypothetical protein